MTKNQRILEAFNQLPSSPPPSSSGKDDGEEPTRKKDAIQSFWSGEDQPSKIVLRKTGKRAKNGSSSSSSNIYNLFRQQEVRKFQSKLENEQLTHLKTQGFPVTVMNGSDIGPHLLRAAQHSLYFKKNRVS
jgi:hypothetical protein